LQKSNYQADGGVLKKMILLYMLHIIFAILYFALFSRELYRGGDIIQLYYPRGILCCVVLTLIYNSFVLKQNITLLAINCGIAIIVFIAVRFLFGYLFRGFIGDYYARGYENLFQLFSYFRERDDWTIYPS